MPGGYHALETIFAFAEDGDALSAERADELLLEIRGPFAGALADEADNLVLRAARRARALWGERRGARLALDKRLPVAAGLGGGSADAAAAVRLLARLWGHDAAEPRVVALAAGLGADVPACLRSRTAFGTGKGDELVLLDGVALAGRPVLLVNPGVALPTGEVFCAHGGADGGPLAPGEPLQSALAGRNDLEPPAVGLRPPIGEVLGLLRDAGGAELVRMSGSGATVFALYGDIAARDAADARLAAAHPGWWRLRTRLR